MFTYVRVCVRACVRACTMPVDLMFYMNVDVQSLRRVGCSDLIC